MIYLLITLLIVSIFFAWSYRKALNESKLRTDGIISDLRRTIAKNAGDYEDLCGRFTNMDALAIDCLRVLVDLEEQVTAYFNEADRALPANEKLAEAYKAAVQFVSSVPSRTAAEHHRVKNLIIRQIAIDKKIQPDVVEACRELVEKNCV